MPSHPIIPAVDRLLTGPAATGSWTRQPKAARPLLIEVLVGVPSETRVNSTFPLIIKGIRQRAEVEARERPEIGEIKVVVRYLAPELFRPDPEPPRPARAPHPRRGTILIYPYDPAAVAAAAKRTPLVSVLERYLGQDIDFLDTDEAAAVGGLVGRLHEAGHTRIGFASWQYPVVNNWVGRRFHGFVGAVKARGLRFDPAWALNVLPDRPSLATDEVVTAAAHLSRTAGVTAWVCGADHQAYPLLRGLRSEGIRVPQECSITGFDGVEPPAGLPRIDSVRINHEHLGRSALTRMVNRIIYPSTPQRKIIVESQLVPGETIAPPPRV
jgi:LacI family transcriptional regulator